MNNKSTVSVIIPTYNRPKLLKRSLASVNNQTLDDFNCLVVDDGSNTSTRTIVDQYPADRFQLIEHENNKGNAATLNTGLKHSKSKYIAFLDDDDEWLPEKLEKQVDFFEETTKDVGVNYTWMNYYNNGDIIKKVHPQYRGYVFPQVLDRQRLGGTPTIMAKREVFKEIGGFDESISRGVVGDFWRRVSLKFKVDYIPEVLVKVHVGHSSGRMTDNSKESIRAAIKGHKVKFEKFGEIINNYPNKKSEILHKIAHHHLALSEFPSCLKNFYSALKANPKSIINHLRWIKRNFEKLGEKAIG